MTPYELLDRVRVLLRNAEASPLPNEEDQDAARYHLEQLRKIYRRVVDQVGVT